MAPRREPGPDYRFSKTSIRQRQFTQPTLRKYLPGVSITLDIYSHCTPNMQQEAAEKINQVLAAALAG